MSDRFFRWGFVAAGLFNLVILVVSHGFTNQVLFETDALFGAGGCAVIVLWGLAYMAVAPVYKQAWLVSAVFALEKLFFVVWWLRFLITRGDELPALWASDLASGFFYSTYGAGDAVFMVFFAIAAVRQRGG